MQLTRQPFVKGINYWPINKAMYWWRDFNLSELKQDFKIISEHNFRMVRIFLIWEDFQPFPEHVSITALDHLKAVADTAGLYNLKLMPTFFCGHMSGVNWMPEWMLDNRSLSQRFPVYSNQLLSYRGIKNFYTEQELIEAQRLQIREVVGALKGHSAIGAYDLGNESSNCAIPPHRRLAQKWLALMTAEIKSIHPGILVTLGMHAEDLEEDRNLWPQDAACCCDFLSMHGFPFYLDWVYNPIDYELLPFLGIITRWLGEKPVLFQEFGAPTISRFAVADSSNAANLKCPLWPEEEVADYFGNALTRLQEEKMIGALAWCFADYHPQLWDKAPLKENLHERYFGMFRYDGSPKPAAAVFNNLPVSPQEIFLNDNHQRNWYPQNCDRNTFYQDPRNNLQLLFADYKKYCAKGEY